MGAGGGVELGLVTLVEVLLVQRKIALAGVPSRFVVVIVGELSRLAFELGRHAAVSRSRARRSAVDLVW